MRWQAEVCRHTDRAHSLSQPQLRDHAPLLVEQFARALDGETTPTVEPAGWEHGRQRWSHDYEITEVLEELKLMRQTLVDVVEQYAASPGLSAEERQEAGRRLHEVLDRSAAASAAQYVSAARVQHQDLEQKLARADQQKDHFLAMLSHELRAPLAPILSAVRVMRHVSPTDPRREQAMEVIERQALYQARLIDDLLDINRIAEGKITLHPELVDLRLPVEQAVETCLPGIKAKGLELKLDLTGAPLMVEGDPVRLGQIVVNIVSNAGRYTDAPGSITLAAGQQDGEVVVRVRDTGIGIAPEMLTRIFDRFVQADTSLDRREGGLGLGLTLARKLAELHGGAVEGYSEGLGRGSEFTVRLPAAGRNAPEGELRSAENAEDVLASRRVLLVDDNADARATLADVLELTGHHVLAAADGPEALRLAWEEQPQACIVDIGLPGMDGFEVARQLRQTPGGGEMLLIALSGYGSPEDKQRATEAGFDAHVTKPARIEELERLLTGRR